MEQKETNFETNAEHIDSKNENSTIESNESSNINTEQNKEEKSNNHQEKIDELNDKYLRLYSEFDNFKRRTSKERIELIKTAGVEIIVEMIPVLDDLERAIKSNDKIQDIEAIKDGIKLIHNKFSSTLIKKGLESMDTLGKEFDSDYHEAITSVPATDESQKGKIIDEIEKGYLVNGKVIRYAKVIVGS